MVDRWNRKWDGTPYRTGGQRVRQLAAGLRKANREARKQERTQQWKREAQATRIAHQERLERDPLYRAKTHAKKKLRENRQQRRNERSENRDLRRGVFTKVTEFGDDGKRHCVRCDGTEFRRKRIRSTSNKAAAVLGIYSLLVTLSGVTAKPHMVCLRCGAAYPVE